MCIFAIVKIDEAIQRFTDYVSSERRLAEGTVRYYISEVERFGRYLYSQDIHLIEEISAQDVRSWQMSLMEEGEAAGTVTKQIAALRAWFKFLRKKGYTDTDIMVKITPPKRAKRLPIFFSEDEVEQIYDDIYPNDYDGELDKLVLRMLYETGMRRAELIGLRDANVDTGKMELKVHGKRDKDRIIPFGTELAQWIDSYRRLRDQQAVGCDSFFVRPTGEPLYPMLVYRVVKELLSQAGVSSKRSPHVLRHTFATAMLNNGASLNSVKELLGHESLATTQIYTHVTFSELKNNYKLAHPRALKKGG